ncbi:MAG: hypothetical protein JW809_14785 [Pirellulales bacterium]|nr:hypothetical protein [Pirellulales bacterium]
MSKSGPEDIVRAIAVLGAEANGPRIVKLPGDTEYAIVHGDEYEVRPMPARPREERVFDLATLVARAATFERPAAIWYSADRVAVCDGQTGDRLCTWPLRCSLAWQHLADYGGPPSFGHQKLLALLVDVLDAPEDVVDAFRQLRWNVSTETVQAVSPTSESRSETKALPPDAPRTIRLQVPFWDTPGLRETWSIDARVECFLRDEEPRISLAAGHDALIEIGEQAMDLLRDKIAAALAEANLAIPLYHGCHC